MSRRRRSPPGTPGTATLRRFSERLLPDSVERDRFLLALSEPPDFPVAVVWLKDRPEPLPFPVLPAPPWLPAWVDLVSIADRPGRHLLHDAGAYYCLDPSSVFESLALTVCAAPATRLVIDVCAAPGGKSILASRLLQPERLICNEVIGKRTAALIANVRRCGLTQAEVVSRDVSRLAAEYPAMADVVIVDAPCSGQSLLAKGKPAPGAFHEATINLNANRQRRILANAAQLVRPGGFLTSMTCTFSVKENERNLEWLVKTVPEFTAVPVDCLKFAQSPYSDLPCYRIWPQDGTGAGGFTSILQRQE